jgi:hemoglobin-like flavoprotein
MNPTCSFSSIDVVGSSWEIARQRKSCGEDIGVKFLRLLFTLYPETTTLFGFQQQQDVLNNPRFRAGIFVHSQCIINWFNDLLMNIGIDFHDVEWMVQDMALYLARNDVKPTIIIGAVVAAKETLRNVFGSKWDERYEDAWSEFLSAIAALTIQSMLKNS